jgi:DNA-binding MarR family transcriptional regulator
MMEASSPAAIRLLMHRKVLAAYRHRAAVARRLGMSESEVTALAHLAQGGMTPGELGRRLQLTSGGVTALLHRLERAGHVDRKPHRRDRRSVIVTANPTMLERIAEFYGPLANDMDELGAGFSGREREVIARYLHGVAVASEQRVEELIREGEEADSAPDEDALHLWA